VDPTYNDSAIEWWISRSTKIGWRFKFRVVICRIRLFPTLISKIKWLGSGLPLRFRNGFIGRQQFVGWRQCLARWFCFVIYDDSIGGNCWQDFLYSCNFRQGTDGSHPKMSEFFLRQVCGKITVFGWMSHPTHVILLSPQGKRYVLIWIKKIIPLTCLNYPRFSRFVNTKMSENVSKNVRKFLWCQHIKLKIQTDFIATFKEILEVIFWHF